MNPVHYGVAVSARRAPAGWNLTLSNGEELVVATLEDAVALTREHLDVTQPGVDHREIAVVLTVDPEPVTGAGGGSVGEPASAPVAESAHAPDADPGTEQDTPDGMDLTLQFLTARADSPDFADAAARVLPWVDDLPGNERQQCLADLWIALNDATEDYNYAPLEDAVSRWQPAGDRSGPPTYSPGPAPTEVSGPVVEAEPVLSEPVAEPVAARFADLPPVDASPVDMPPRTTPPPVIEPAYVSLAESAYVSPADPVYAPAPEPAREPATTQLPEQVPEPAGASLSPSTGFLADYPASGYHRHSGTPDLTSEPPEYTGYTAQPDHAAPTGYTAHAMSTDHKDVPATPPRPERAPRPENRRRPPRRPRSASGGGRHRL